MPSIITGGYAPPGVYTQTLFGTAPTLPAVPPLVPLFIGTGSEILVQTNLPVVRGSSSSVDQQIVNEDETNRAVLAVNPDGSIVLGPFDGVTTTKFRVKNYPIVSGAGAGVTATDTSAVSVTVNGEPTVVLGLDGAKGVVEIGAVPGPSDVVLCTYYFKRTDTRVTDDVSAQVTATKGVINGQVGQSYTFVAGSTDQLKLTVDGLPQVTVTFPPGTFTSAVVAATINGTLGIGSLVASTFLNNLGQTCVRLTANKSIVIGDGTANSVLGFVANTATSRNATFYVFNGPIVNGNNGGVTTTNPGDVVVLVDGVAVTPVSVNGRTRAVTLPFAPAPGSDVTIQYYFNAWQDTFDYLANTGVVRINRAAITPNSNGAGVFIQGADYILKNDTIVWGTASLVNPGLHTEGFATFGQTQVTALLVDNQMFLAPCTRVVNTTGTVTTVSKRDFQLPYQPTTGNGRANPLGSSQYQIIANGRIDLPTDQPGLVIAYWGFGAADAMERGPVAVAVVNSDTSTITLSQDVPEGANVYATFYYNTLVDQAFFGTSRGYTLTCLTAGTSGFGTYSILDGLNRPMYGVKLMGKGSALNSITVNFPSGSEFLPDARLENGVPVLETVVVQFASTDATPARFTAPNSGVYYTIGGFSSNLRVTFDGVAGSTGGASGTQMQFPTEGSRGGSFASVLGDEVQYDAASGETTYTITTGVNDTVSLLVDGVSITATAAAGAGNVSVFQTAVNNAALASAPYYTSAGAFPNGFTVVALASDQLILRYRGDVSGDSTDRTITLAPGSYTSTALLVAQIQAQLDTINGVGGLNADVSVVATADSKLRFSLVRSLARDVLTVGVLPLAASTVTIDGVVYTFVAAPAAPYDVLIGGTIAATIANLVAAITAGPGAGVVYGVGTAVHPTVTASVGLVVNTMVATAKTAGSAANTIAVSTTVVGAAWATPTLANGDDSGFLEFRTNGTAARDFAVVAGIDTGASLGTQTKLFHGPIATVYTPAVPLPSLRRPYDRLVLRNRIFPGAGSMTAHSALAQTQLYSQGGNGASLAGIPVGTTGEASWGGGVLGPSMLGVVGWDDGQNASGQPDVLFYDGTGSNAANNVFKITANGTLVTVVFPASGAGTAIPLGPASLGTSVIGRINAAITTAGLSGIAAVQEGNAIRIFASGVAYQSQSAQLIMGDGTATARLGFTPGALASASGITARAMASTLMSHNANANFTLWMLNPASTAAGYFPARALAGIVTDGAGATYLYLQSKTYGTSSSIVFGTSSTADALLTGTNLGIVSGNFSNGEAAVNGFFVTSSDPTSGSGSANTSVFNLGVGQDGVVGQTYVDDVTGLTFTILPRSGGLQYPTGANATITFQVSTTLVTDANIPTLAIPGLELTVANTAGVAPGDTALVETFKRGGGEPGIGEIYYVSYEYTKTDFSPKLFARIQDVVNEYGPVSPDNPLSLAAHLAFLNGSTVIGCMQVPKAPGSAAATETEYLNAIDRAAGTSLPNFISPAVLVLLTPATDTLIRHMTIHCDVQSSIRYQSERTAIFGFSAGTRPTDAIAKSAIAGNTRIRFVYPDIASLSLTDVLGNTKTYLVDGRYPAVAVAAATTAPTIDPATPWESRSLVGFDSLNRRLDAVTMNQLAVGGITVLENRPPFIRIRHGLTSDMSNVLTKTPTVIQIADEMQRRVRATCQPFVGAKFLPQLLGQIEGRLSEMFKSAIQEQIITSFTGLTVTADPTDPTAIIVNVYYQPVFPLLFIQVVLRVSAQ